MVSVAEWLDGSFENQNRLKKIKHFLSLKQLEFIYSRTKE